MNCIRLLALICFVTWRSVQTVQAFGMMTPSFAENVPNITVVAGKDVVLPCVVDNLEHFKVAWVRVDTQTILTIHTKVISRNPRVGLAQSSKRHWYLRLRNVEPSDRGYYMCQINTDPMEHSKGYLEVLVPPNIVDSGTTDGVVAREGSNVSLSCRATGHPEPNITWKREDGSEFIYNGVAVSAVESEVLQLTKASRLHMGPYLCIASNGVPPSVSQRIPLKIQFPPMLWIPNQQELAYNGQDVVLVCHIEAYPKSINYWTTAKGDMIISGDKYEAVSSDDSYRVYMRLKIRSVALADFGAYKCVAKNSLGETDGTIKLYEIANPHTTFSVTTMTIGRQTSTETAIRHAKKKERKRARPNSKRNNNNSPAIQNEVTDDNNHGDVVEDEAPQPTSGPTNYYGTVDSREQHSHSFATSTSFTSRQCCFTNILICCVAYCFIVRQFIASFSV
uniref:Ig-like domain-containing protein n=1 Tax=Daphnia galeata TaxID=27404 RepID=A0A8J2RBT7_9CRUS|nr:unnamed protein product [Daphnia galeata]